MGRGGPRPLPAELRDPDGPHATPIILSPTVSAMEPPARLDVYAPGAAAVWRELIPPLVRVGLVQDADLPGVEALCMAVATMREAQEILSREGLFVKSPNGYRIAHPALGVRDKSSSEYRHWAARFGLTPSDRVALGLQVVKGQTAASAWGETLGAQPRKAD